MGRQWDLMCGLSELESSLKTPFRPSKGSEKSIGVPRWRPHCGCKNPCKCNPCHCNGFAIDPNTVTLFASIAPPVLLMPSEGSENSIEVSSCNGPACGCSPSCDCKPECHCEGPSEDSEKSIEAEWEGIHPKLVMALDECQPCQCWAIMDILQPEK